MRSPLEWVYDWAVKVVGETPPDDLPMDGENLWHYLRRRSLSTHRLTSFWFKWLVFMMIWLAVVYTPSLLGHGWTEHVPWWSSVLLGMVSWLLVDRYFEALIDYLIKRGEQ